MRKVSQAIAIKANVKDRKEVNNLFDIALGSFNNIDVLVNCAGKNLDKPFLEMSDHEWNEVQSIILKGTFNCSQEFALRYKGNNGHIINIGALTAIKGRKNGANYCSARAGVLNLSKCMAQELAPSIRVNSITPGWINTSEVMERYKLFNQEIYEQILKTIPMKRLGTPEDVSKMISFMICDSTYITGQNFLVDGGMLMY